MTITSVAGATLTSSATNRTATDDNAATTETTTANVISGSADIPFVFDNEEVISAGATVEYVVKADVTSTATAGASSSIASSLVESASAFSDAANYAGVTGDFIFSDNAASTANRDGSSIDYYNGYKTNAFPTDVKSIAD